MIVSQCPSCEGSRLYQFSATERPGAPSESELPQVCRTCSSVIVDGVVIPLPVEFGELAVSMTSQSEVAAKVGREDLEQSKGNRIETWLKNYFRSAYMDGFMRSLAYWNHHGKEGRLVRMRELWNGATRVANISKMEPGKTGVMFTLDEYNEFRELLKFSPGAKNVPSTKN